MSCGACTDGTHLQLALLPGAALVIDDDCPRLDGTGTRGPRPRTVKMRPLSFALKGGDLIAFHRILAQFPPGVLSVGRIARLCLRAGLPQVEAELRVAAEKYADGPKIDLTPIDGENR